MVDIMTTIFKVLFVLCVCVSVCMSVCLSVCLSYTLYVETEVLYFENILYVTILKCNRIRSLFWSVRTSCRVNFMSHKHLSPTLTVKFMSSARLSPGEPSRCLTGQDVRIENESPGVQVSPSPTSDLVVGILVAAPPDAFGVGASVRTGWRGDSVLRLGEILRTGWRGDSVLRL